MALVYRKSTKSTARKYERSPGMEPNTGGVTHMTVINPGRPSRNPFQWIHGQTSRHKHLSPAYRTVRGAKDWAKRHEPESGHARLYPVDEYGTIMSRPMSRKQVLSQNPRRSQMGYNLGALRRAMRANMSAEDREAIKAAARGMDTTSPGKKKRRSRKHSRTTVKGGRVTARASRRTKRTASRRSKKTASRRRSSKRTSKRPASRKRSSKKASRRRSSKRASKKRTSRKRSSKKRTSKRASKGRATAKGASASAKSASKQASAAKKAASRAKRATSKKVASKAASSARKHASKARKAATVATKKASKAKPSSRKAASKAAAKARAAASTAETAASVAARASKMAARRGRLSRKVGKFTLTSKAYRGYKRVKGFSASPFRTGRLFNPPFVHVTSQHPGRRAAGIRMAANMLGRVSQRRGVPVGQRVQLVEFGPRSKRKGYSVYVPGTVSERAYVRKFRFGGAAKRAHERALRTGYSRKRYSTKRVSANSRRTSMRRNSRKRHSKKRRSSRRRSRRVSRNPKYVLINGRRRGRRVRRNGMTIFGIDPVSQVLMPGGYAVAGLMVANAAANMAANVEGIRNVLDSGRTADEAMWTKSLVGAGVAGLSVALSGKLPAMLRSNLGPIVAGMGCAVAVRLLRGTQLSPYLGRYRGFGEYVEQPMGAYVQDPSMGEYVEQPMGEYVEQPMGGLGTMYAAAGYPEGVDPADQGGVDGLMDVMEAAAGVGAFEAAAGMGTMYAAAGMGAADAAADLRAIAPGAFRGAGGSVGLPQPPFVSIETPVDMARKITAVMPRDLNVPSSLVTPEGKGYAGGLFSKHLFAGMI